MYGNVFARLFERLAAVPHRSISALSYSDWFTLYVQALKTSTIQNNTNEFQKAQSALNVAFLSSAVSQKWTDVILPNSKNQNTTEVLWWQENAKTNWIKPLNINHKTELITTSFLIEPLLSGRAIRSWTDAVRKTSSNVTTNNNNNNNNNIKNSCIQKVMVVVPFTALFHLRSEAYPRPQGSLETKEGNEQQQKQKKNQLSLQERSFRVSVLNSLHNLMELQSNSNRQSSIEIIVWNPLSEFDAIMQFSRVRNNLPKSLQNIFSLSQICENEVVRMVYLYHYLRFITNEISLNVLAPQIHHTNLRKLGIINTCVKDKTFFVDEIRSLGNNSTNSSLHQQTVSNCGKLVRRMATREENLRHILTP